MNSKRIGILGGSFNPLHNSHLCAAKRVTSTLKLDELIFIPNNSPPHKKFSSLALYKHRYNMLYETVKNISSFSVSTLEKENNIHYTIDTLNKIAKNNLYVNASFFLIIGMDSLCNFSSWKNPEEILSFASLVVIERRSVNNSMSIIKDFEEKYNTKIYYINLNKKNISSTTIRDDIYHANIIKNVPVPVKKYIAEYELYNYLNTKKINIKMLKKELKNRLNYKRYKHSLRVATLSKKLGKFYNINPKYSYIAGLLHDNSKCYSNEEYLSLAKNINIEITESIKDNPSILHGVLGATWCSDFYNIKDENFLNSIKYHTTGRAQMSLLEKIIYIADYIEPKRKHSKNLPFLRKLVYKNIDKTLEIILSDTIDLLNQNNKVIDKNTLFAYNYYKGVNK